MSNIEISTLSAIPYLDLQDLQDRFICTLSFNEEGRWRTWMPVGDGLLEINAWPAESWYFSANPATPSDLYLHFLDFIAQQASFSGLQKPIAGLQDDLFNLSASLAKVSLLHANRDSIGVGAYRMATTEVEYIFTVCRSIFDLLQEMIAVLWESVVLHDPSIKKRPLKETFSDMMHYKGQPATQLDFIERFGLPEQLASFYVRHTDFFLSLRRFRDNIIHRGSQVQTIFTGESGFLIKNMLNPFAEMEIWHEEEKQPNNLVPLYPALGMLAYKTLAVCEDFSTTISQVISFPKPLAPGMKLFLTGFFDKEFSATLQDAGRRIGGAADLHGSAS